jgi:hypothetical protein
VFLERCSILPVGSSLIAAVPLRHPVSTTEDRSCLRIMFVIFHRFGRRGFRFSARRPPELTGSIPEEDHNGCSYMISIAAVPFISPSDRIRAP